MGALALLYSVSILLALLLPLQRLAGPKLTCIASESLWISRDKALIIHPFRLERAFVHHRGPKEDAAESQMHQVQVQGTNRTKQSRVICELGSVACADGQADLCAVPGNPLHIPKVDPIHSTSYQAA